MSLIADALKRAQSGKFGRRYLSPEPSGVLPVARENQRRTEAGSSVWSAFRLSPTLLIGLGSGLFFFLLLFVYFFYGTPAKMKSPAPVSSAPTSKGLILSPPPAVPLVEPLPLEKEAALAQEPVKSGEQLTPRGRTAPAEKELAQLPAEKRPSTRAVEESKTGRSSKRNDRTELTVVSNLSQEVRYHFNLGLSYQEEKNFSRARREYERALELWPLYGEAHNNLGVVYKELGLYDEAIREFKKASALDPSYAKAYHNLGVIYQMKGDWKQAAKNYETALSLDRNHIGAYNNLGLVYRSQNQPHEAREILEKALAVNPSFPQTHYNLALVLEEIGEMEQARSHYQKFIDLSGGENRELVERVRFHLRKLIEKK